MQTDLFGNDVLPTNKKSGFGNKQTRPAPKETGTGNTCGNCANLYRHSYNNNMKYCSKLKQFGTSYGNLKVKSRDAACGLWETIFIITE